MWRGPACHEESNPYTWRWRVCSSLALVAPQRDILPGCLGLVPGARLLLLRVEVDGAGFIDEFMGLLTAVPLGLDASTGTLWTREILQPC